MKNTFIRIKTRKNTALNFTTSTAQKQ